VEPLLLEPTGRAAQATLPRLTRIQASDMHLPGLLPWAILVQESTPVVDQRPAFLFPPPEFLFTNEAAFLALDDAFINVIFIYIWTKDIIPLLVNNQSHKRHLKNT
jgi:hypothetical protein